MAESKEVKTETAKVEKTSEKKEETATKATTEVKKDFVKRSPQRRPFNKKITEDKNEVWGMLHIYSSYNNTHLHVTDITGSETITKVTGGMVTKSDRLKATPNIAMAAAKDIASACLKAGVNSLYVKLRGVGGHNGPMNPGPGAQAAIRMLTRHGMKLGRIEDVTPVPHDTCRKKGGRRGRRV